jgi:hypothetical protein
LGQDDTVFAQTRQEIGIDEFFDCFMIQIHDEKLIGLVSISKCCVICLTKKVNKILLYAKHAQV